MNSRVTILLLATIIWSVHSASFVGKEACSRSDQSEETCSMPPSSRSNPLCGCPGEMACSNDLDACIQAGEITLDLRTDPEPTPDAYKSFLDQIRNEVKDPSLVYGGTNIPVIGAPTGTYLRVAVLSDSGDISFAVKKNDIYIAGYLGLNNQQQPTIYYFLGTPEDEISKLQRLFPEANGKIFEQEYREGYAAIEYAAKIRRVKAGLGIGKFRTYLERVVGQPRDVENEAKLILITVQMISEATRFSYIEDEVIANFPYGFSSNSSFIVREQRWMKMTKDVKMKSKNGVFESPITYTYKGDQIIVENVNDMKVALFGYCEGKCEDAREDIWDAATAAPIHLKFVSIIILIALGFVF